MPEHPTSIIVESDCQVAVMSINNSVPIFSPFGTIIDDCQSILNDIQNVTIQFVKRSGNKAADCLARLSFLNQVV